MTNQKYLGNFFNIHKPRLMLYIVNQSPRGRTQACGFRNVSQLHLMHSLFKNQWTSDYFQYQTSPVFKAQIIPIVLRNSWTKRTKTLVPGCVYLAISKVLELLFCMHHIATHSILDCIEKRVVYSVSYVITKELVFAYCAQRFTFINLLMKYPLLPVYLYKVFCLSVMSSAKFSLPDVLL